LRYGATQKLRQHRADSFKFSSDPQFARKVRDIVGLYMNPPDKANGLSVGKKSQIHALDRTQPILGCVPGCPSAVTPIPGESLLAGKRDTYESCFGHYNIYASFDRGWRILLRRPDGRRRDWGLVSFLAVHLPP
jgi:hypothetical protein